SISGTRIRLFFAASTAFLMAFGTSFALPVPKPTCPFSSPTTTRAANDIFLPPFTTLVTRLIWISWSLSINPFGEILLVLFITILLFGLRRRFGLFALAEPALAGSVDQCFDAAVINVSAAVEHDAGNSGCDSSFGNGLAYTLCSFDVA